MNLSNSSKDKIQKICLSAVLAALSVILIMFVHFPIFPAAPYLEYDMSDVPALLAGFSMGPVYGLGVLAISSLIQAFFLGGNGIIGFIMHFAASGVLIIVSAFIYQIFNKHILRLEGVKMGGNLRHIVASAPEDVFCEYNNTETREMVAESLEQGAGALSHLRKLCDTVVLMSGLVLGSLGRIAIMIPLNLLFTPLLFKIPVSAVAELILPVLLPFNFIVSFGNSLVAFLLFVPFNLWLKKAVSKR